MTSSDMSDEDLLAKWELIIRAFAHTQERVLARIEVAGLPSLWFAALHLLLRSDEHRLPMSRLARELSITTGGFTKLADRMGQEGLIDRRNSSGDRRVVYAALTEKGLRVARRSERQYNAALREHVLETLTPAKLVELADSARLLEEAGTAGAKDVPALPAALQRETGLPERATRPASARR